MQNKFSQPGNDSTCILEKSFFRIGMWNSGPPPPLHGKKHLKFPFWSLEHFPNWELLKYSRTVLRFCENCSSKQAHQRIKTLYSILQINRKWLKIVPLWFSWMDRRFVSFHFCLPSALPSHFDSSQLPTTTAVSAHCAQLLKLAIQHPLKFPLKKRVWPWVIFKCQWVTHSLTDSRTCWKLNELT